MDHTVSQKHSFSGIPRPSKLPLPRAALAGPKTVRSSPSGDRLQVDKDINVSRLRNPSGDLAPSTAGSTFKKPIIRPSTVRPPARKVLPKVTEPTLDEPKSVTPPAQLADASDTQNTENGERHGATEIYTPVTAKRKPRPSLSDRTIETLAQIPPSPSPARRRSNFFPESPMGPPARPASAMSSRPSSRFASRPTSPTKNLKPPVLGNSNTKPSVYGGSKSMAVRTSKPRASLAGVFAAPADAGMTTLPSPKKPSPATRARRASSIVKGPETPVGARQVSKSSSTLRAEIAKAKAAARKNNNEAGLGKEIQGDIGRGFEDAPNHEPLPRHFTSDKGLLRKRVAAARPSGQLNIAAMGLKQFPDEVMDMYEFDPNSNAEWYESVDLVKVIAADNEMEDLRQDAFPDASVGPNEEERTALFTGLEVLDLRGNSLKSVPPGLGRLGRLHSLNLSGNCLSMESLQYVISGLSSLKELKLASNALKGDLTPRLCCLTSLQILDLRGNALRTLPSECFAAFSVLKVLELSDNKLTSLPFDALANLPLVEINVSRNCLQGTLLPDSVGPLQLLKVLNVANNALEALTISESITMPNLQSLIVNGNRLAALPNFNNSPNLLTLTAADNRLGTVPEGFASLPRLRNADFSSNNITKLDERIGLMEELVSLRVTSNPLRDRKFLTMTTDDLKRDLRKRCCLENDADRGDPDGKPVEDIMPDNSSNSTHDKWQIKPGGVLDRSSTGLVSLAATDLETHLPVDADIRSLQLHHNRLNQFPTEPLGLLSQRLMILDVSHNAFAATYLDCPLALPQLQSLNLISTNLTRLDALTTYLRAPSLHHLDVSANRLKGVLPPVRSHFPTLTTLLVADNAIEEIPVDAVRGLRVLDATNNAIKAIDPKLGLLSGELKQLGLRGNMFKVPRPDTVNRGTDAVLAWLREKIPVEELEQVLEPEEVVDDQTTPKRMSMVQKMHDLRPIQLERGFSTDSLD